MANKDGAWSARRNVLFYASVWCQILPLKCWSQIEGPMGKDEEVGIAIVKNKSMRAGEMTYKISLSGADIHLLVLTCVGPSRRGYNLEG